MNASALIEAPVEGIEQLGSGLKSALSGLGLRTVMSRFVVGGGATYGLIYWLKPRFFFTDSGVRRPWSATNEAATAVIVTPEMAALLVAFVFGNI